MKQLFINARPHLLAIAMGLLLTVVYYSPLILDNKVMSQHDVQQGLGAGQEIKDFRIKTGDEALWTNSMFSGMPAYLISVAWTGDLIRHVQQVATFYMPSAAQVTFLSFACFYILLIVFGVRPALAFMGAVAYGFGTFSIISIEAGHIWKVRAIAYMPLVLAAVHLIFNSSKKLLAVGLLSLAVALEIQANHLQITYYLFLMLLIYGGFQLYETIKSGQWSTFGKNIALLLIAATMGVGANTGRLWTTLEYSQYSTRGKSELTPISGESGQSGLDRDYVFNWSYGILESFTLLIPNFSGGASQQTLDESSNLGKALTANRVSRSQIRDQLKAVPTYWGDQPGVAGPTYVGAIICFLFVLGIMTVESKTRNWILVATTLSLLLAWGKNLEWFNFVFYDYFPGYNKFRSVSMTMVILLLCVPLLGLLGLEQFLKTTDSKKMKKLLISGGITGGLALIFVLFAGIFSFRGAADVQLASLPGWFTNALLLDRESLLRMDAVRSLVLIAGALGTIYYMTKEKLKPTMAFLILSALVVFDFWQVDKRFLNDENYERKSNQQFFNTTPADQKIIQQADAHYRVLNLLNPFNEAKTSVLHSSLGGYHGAKMRRYQELIERCLSGNISIMITQLQNQSFDPSVFPVINMLNAQFIKFGDQQGNVISNPSAYGNAWFVKELRVVSSANEEIAATCNLESQNTAIINGSIFEVSQQNYSTSGTIVLTDYQPNMLKYKVNSEESGFVVFSEIYYPEGWVASIDGNQSEIKQVNYVLRGMEIPTGAKEIVFEFRPNAYFIGNRITLVFSSLILLLITLSLFLRFRK